jgi:hypothetical protein
MMRLAYKSVLVFIALAVLAGTSLATSVRADGATLLVNEVPVLTLRTAPANATPSARAANLAAALRAMPSINPVSVQKTRTDHRIIAGGKTVLIIDAREASAQGSTTAALATQWSQRLRSALILPPLRVSETYVRLGGGATRTIALTGSRAHEAVVESADEQVVVARKSGGSIVVTATGVGSTNVVVGVAGAMLTIEVEVRPYAANFPQTLTATVTGNPATIETVQGAVAGAVRNQMQSMPMSELAVSAIPTAQLAPGESRSFTVKVAATAPEAMPRDGTVTVSVRNLSMQHRRETHLWYCNDPENVFHPGPLFNAALRVDQPARLLYHHMNAGRNPLFINVQVVNNSDTGARVLLIPGDSKPDKNPVLVGLLAADQFVKNWVRFSGEVLEIPPRSALPVSIRRVYPGQTMSGLAYLRLLEGGPEQLTVRTDALVPFGTDARWGAALASSTPWREVGVRRLSAFEAVLAPMTDHVYPDPFREETFSYEVGGRYGFLRIGQRPIARKYEGKALDGNFGVVYNIRANAANPTDQAIDVEVVFEASAGYSGALFFVNEEYKRTPLLQPKAEYQIARFRLGPSESRNLRITTVPLSGSSYPSTLTMRPVRDTLVGGAPSAPR